MQIYFIINALVLYAVSIAPTMVSADQMVRFVFNNGIEPSTPVCNPKENAMIDALFLPKATRRRLRHLKTKNEDVNTEVEADPYMVSATTALKCSDLCIGVKSCRVTGCIGFDGTIKSTTKPNRGLQHLCESKILDIGKELDALPVSTSCKNYLAASKRSAECYDNVR